MKLYTNGMGSWVGTQSEAKKAFGVTTSTEVPTDKAALLDFLNENKVGGAAVTSPDTTTEYPRKPFTAADAPVGDLNSRVYPHGKPHQFTTIRECAENASLTDLHHAIHIYLERMDELIQANKS
jgi:hypothetical protein